MSPGVREMVEAYRRIKSAGLVNIRLGNLGVFIRTENDRACLKQHVDIRDV